MLNTLVSSSLATRADWQKRAKIPTASVIVVNYNGRSHLDVCLQSVLAHSGRDVELILVDNQSDDGSADYVIDNYPQVQVIKNQNNGYGAGNNLAATVALGTYLVFLNPDTCVAPGWLDSLLLPLAVNANIGMTTPKIALMNDPLCLNTAGNDVHVSGLTLCRGMGESVDAFAETAVVSAVSGAAFAMRRELFDQLGGFDADFFLYMEDTDLSLRAQLAGFSCLYVPQSVVYHDYTLRMGRHKIFYQELNRYVMLLKIWRWRTLFALIPVLLAAEMITWAFVLLNDRQHFMNKFKAYTAVLSKVPMIIVKRKRTQMSRRVRDRELLNGLTHQLAFEQTGQGTTTKIAHYLFDPMFGFVHWVLCNLVWW